MSNKSGVMVSAEDMVLGRTYKLENGVLATLNNKKIRVVWHGSSHKEQEVELTFSNDKKSTIVYPNKMYEEVAQEGGKRKTRRQRKSRKVRRRQTKRRR